MKKCRQCGAVQSDDRNTCLDCGAVLGRPLSEEEEQRMEEELSDALHGMSERTEDFYVSPIEKFLGIFSILAAVALVIMVNLIGGWSDALEKQAIEAEGYLSYSVSGSGEIHYVTEDGVSGIIIGGNPMRNTPAHRALESAAIAALVGIFCCIGAALFFLCPKFLWTMETLRFRLWYHNWDDTPSDFALIMYKVWKYVFFAGGCFALLAMVLYLI